MEVQIIVPIGCSLLSAGCAVFVAWRASRWRESDEVKAITARIDLLEKGQAQHDTRIDGVEDQVAELPTKADIRGLEEQVKGLAREQHLTHAGVSRIESLFITRGIAATQ